MDTIKRVSQWLLPLLCILLLLTVISNQTVSISQGTESLNNLKWQLSEKWEFFKEATEFGTGDFHVLKNENILFFLVGVVLSFFCRKVPILNSWLNFLSTLQHELTHHITASFFGGVPVAMEVSVDDGGAAHSTKSNCLIRLSPYTVPLFTVVFLGLSWLFSKDYRWSAILLAGLFYANFLAKTFASLRCSQPDIERSGGRMIALPVLFVLNIVVLAGIGHIVKGL